MHALLGRVLVSALVAASLTPFVAAKGCAGEDSADVNQSRINTFYWLYVDANADTTSVRAQFRFGGPLGTLLHLDAPASVKVDGKTMGYNDLLGWHETTLAGQSDDVDIVYLDADGDTFTNHLGPVRPLTVKAGTALTIDRSHSFTLPLDGEPLGKDETIEVTVQSVGDPLQLQIFLGHTEGADDIVLTQDKLDTLPAGAARIIVKRHADSVPAEMPAAGGKITVTFQAEDAAATLE